MQELSLRYYCYVCGHPNELNPKIPEAPKMTQVDIACEKCGDTTHVLLTSCPACKKEYRYFLSDLDFPEELRSLSKSYVKIIEGIKESLADYVEEFKVPVPKKWTVHLECSCGQEYDAELSLQDESN